MIYKTIQGEDVPALGLGTWLLTGDACRKAVEHALDLGYRHIDTAQAYENEDQVGQGLQNAGIDRDDLFLTTKIWLENLSPGDVRESVEASLRRLRTDYVDLLLIHWPNDKVPLEQTLDAMVVLQDEGKTRHLGVSNFTPSLLQRALNHAKLFCNQVEYHPFFGQDPLLAMAREHDLLLTAYSPLARGRVTDDETLQAIGEAHNKTPAQVALRWLLQQDHVAAIPKASSAKHREDNFDLFDFELSDNEMDRITALDQGKRIVDPEFAPAWEH